MTMDMKEQVLTEIKTSPLFYFQVDESTDVSSCSQLFIFVRYFNSGDIKDEFLFCSELKAQQKLMMSWEKFQLVSKMKIFNGKTCVRFVQMGHRLCWHRNQVSSRERRG